MDQDQDERVSVASPLYIFAISLPCYSCGTNVETISIATSNLSDPECDDPHELDGEVCVLNNIQSLPEEIMTEVQAGYPQYQSRHSLTAGLEYLMTICSCGAHQGDFFVNKALFDAASYDSNAIKVEKLRCVGRWKFACGYSVSSAYDELLVRKESP